MNTEIISIGDELLIGQVVNTNAAWMAEQLNLAGIEVIRITCISDTREDILSSLKEAASRADVILITGGLGPTRDDITKATLCEYFDSRLVPDPETLTYLKKMYEMRGWRFGRQHQEQAEIPDKCSPILNQHGSAPGMWFEEGGKIFVSMPGVPYEMKAMMSENVLPAILEKLDRHIILHRKVQTQGMGESMVARRISKWEDSLPENMKLAYLPQPGMVRLRLSGRGDDRQKLEQQMDEKIEQLKKIIPELIFGYGESPLEEVVGRILSEKGRTLSTAESCTGGYIAHLITSIPGSSEYFTGSIVAYSNRIKTDVLGVRDKTLIDHGAVSEACVTEMALGIKEKFNTDYSIAVSGVAGPAGGTIEKPVGTVWIAIAGPDSVVAEKFLFGNNRQRIIRITALTALNKLRLMILQQG
ncbi:MAG: competence/damage-inducible protein A [Bacteroidales bacterium]|jgi:nicotinamide-nucleotide amidase|nr:competence/damage-inducible protein A [Bacteroidales bacterium]